MRSSELQEGNLALCFVPVTSFFSSAGWLSPPLDPVSSFPAREERHLVEGVLLPCFSSFFSALVREAARPFTRRSRDTFDAASRTMRCSRRGVTSTRPQASDYTVGRSSVQVQGLGCVEPGESDSEVRVWDGRGSCAAVRGAIVQYSPRRTRSDDRNVCLLEWRRMCEKGQWE